MTRPLLLALALTLLAAAPAAAEQVEITRQAKAARAEFLLAATPPAPAATICLVDTGVSPNLDTPRVVDRLAVDGEPADESPSLHGTLMAMLIGAPPNEYGMVGLWPSARILSVRATVSGREEFEPALYIHGVKRCDEEADVFGVKVIVLALSSTVPLTRTDSRAFADAVGAARSKGMNVVAAAGNTGGGALGVPASVPGLFSIGASDSSTAAVCASSASGARLLAPGCSIDAARPADGEATTDVQGTSVASVIAAAGLAALRTWRPDLSPDEAERLLTSTASDGRLDLTAAFTAAGLSHLTPQPATPTATPQPATPTATPQPLVKQPRERLRKPKLRVRVRGRGAGRRLIATIANRPRGTTLTVTVYARDKRGALRRIARRSRNSSSIVIRLRRWSAVQASLSDPTGVRLPSPRVTVRSPR